MGQAFVYANRGNRGSRRKDDNRVTGISKVVNHSSANRYNLVSRYSAPSKTCMINRKTMADMIPTAVGCASFRKALIKRFLLVLSIIAGTPRRFRRKVSTEMPARLPAHTTTPKSPRPWRNRRAGVSGSCIFGLYANVSFVQSEGKPVNQL